MYIIMLLKTNSICQWFENWFHGQNYGFILGQNFWENWEIS